MACIFMHVYEVSALQFAFDQIAAEEEEEEEFLGLKPPNNEIKYIIKSIELFILMSSHSFNFM